ncbi:hypothetical protein J4Q44_G00217550 [Coregonus suidteri]|uniref:Uncharacterized protein n=1 Tax=Coregonus suidteri TaxID=861788 RepID=A0AAN8LF93_9TELE
MVWGVTAEGTCDGCSFHFLWRSQYACPLCTESHYREIVSACRQGIQRTIYVWQQSLQCTGGVSLPAQTVSACVTLDFWLKVGESTGTIAAKLLISISCYFLLLEREDQWIDDQEASQEQKAFSKQRCFLSGQDFGTIEKNYVCRDALSRQSTECSEVQEVSHTQSQLQQPRVKLNGSTVETPSHHDLHRELLYEQEEIRRREEQERGVPEFVRVKDNLRRTQMSGQ